MQKAAALVPLLVLGFSWTVQGLPVAKEPLYKTQDNFDLDKFLGTWYDVVTATKFPFVQHLNRNGSISKLEMVRGSSDSKVKKTRTIQIHGVCRVMAGEYDITGPGRMFYTIPKWNVDIDAYVIKTDYEEYAIVLLKHSNASEEASVTIKLYSRTRTVRDDLLEDVKALAGQHGIGEEDIFIKQDRGDCVVAEEEGELRPPAELQRSRRNVVAIPDDTEGSGIDLPFFNGTESCRAAPDTGPCFGLMPRFFYNSSSMSCERFNYGGCLGNQNNFMTERECLQRCRTEAVCRLPMSPQPCTLHPPIWAFDSSAGLCVPYKVDFCQTNANKFYSKAECEEYCGKTDQDDGEFLAAN